MAAPLWHAIVGSETGLLKGVSLSDKSWKNLNEIQSPEKSTEITCLCWHDDIESEFSVGLRCQRVAKYNVTEQTFKNFDNFQSDSNSFLRDIAIHKDRSILAVESGLVTVWSEHEIQKKISTGTHLQCMVKFGCQIGTGGKENDLKVWDLNDPRVAIFQAKNVRNDWLNLRVPVWITGIAFHEDNRIITSTGHHQVRVYDTKVQRRPVLEMTFDEYPLTAMSAYGDTQVMVGNTQGSMALLDIRKGKLVHKFKGYAGAIKSLQCHRSLPVVASCGLDRFFRVHDLNTRELQHKIYLKSRLNCMLLSKQEWSRASAGDDDELHGQSRDPINIEDTTDIEASGGADDLWENMEVVKTRTRKRKSGEPTENMTKVNRAVKKKTAKKSKAV